MMIRTLFFLCLTITCSQLTYAQDGPFKFDGKTDVFIGNVSHWKAVQDSFSNLVFSSWSTRYIKVNSTSFLQNGNVGIGITTPTTKLQVEGEMMAKNFVTIGVDPGNDTSPAAGGVRLSGRGQNGTKYNWNISTAAVGGGNGVDANALEIWEYPGADSDKTINCCRERLVIDRSAGNSSAPTSVVIDRYGRLAIGGYRTAGENMLSVNGNVGIGTTDTKGYKLAVAGSMIAEKIKVKNYAAWPDFVFHADYALPSLQSVEAYVIKYHHLPDMPSAKEVAAEGLDLGEMNRKLLQKVEELTLYLIAERKEREEMKKEIIKLRKMITTKP